MKTKTHAKAMWASLLGLSIVGLASLFLSACGSGGSGGNAVPGSTAYGRGCSTCQRGSQVLQSGISNANNNGIQFAFDFFADGASNMGNYNYTSPIYGSTGGYTGPARVQGLMYVNNGALTSYGMGTGCSIPRGQYSIVTIGAGQWDSSGASIGGFTTGGIQVEARGNGAVITMIVDAAIFFPRYPKPLDCRRLVYDSEMMGQVTVVNVRDRQYGMACNAAITLEGYRTDYCPLVY